MSETALIEFVNHQKGNVRGRIADFSHVTFPVHVRGTNNSEFARTLFDKEWPELEQTVLPLGSSIFKRCGRVTYVGLVCMYEEGWQDDADAIMRVLRIIKECVDVLPLTERFAFVFNTLQGRRTPPYAAVLRQFLAQCQKPITWFEH